MRVRVCAFLSVRGRVGGRTWLLEGACACACATVRVHGSACALCTGVGSPTPACTRTPARQAYLEIDGMVHPIKLPNNPEELAFLAEIAALEARVRALVHDIEHLVPPAALA